MVEAGVPMTEPSGEHSCNPFRFHSSPDSYLPEILPLLKFYDHDSHEADLPGDSVTSVFGGQGIVWTNNSQGRPIKSDGSFQTMHPGISYIRLPSRIWELPTMRLRTRSVLVISNAVWSRSLPRLAEV